MELVKITGAVIRGDGRSPAGIRRYLPWLRRRNISLRPGTGQPGMTITWDEQGTAQFEIPGIAGRMTGS